MASPRDQVHSRDWRPVAGLPLDSQAAAIAARVRSAPSKPLWESTAAEVREQRTALRRSHATVGPRVARVDAIAIPAAGHTVPARVIVPEDAEGVVVYLHGGGWVTGTLDGWEPFARTLACAAGASVVLVDYRLAPEHPFPAAVDDAWTALCWAGRQLDGPLAVAGESSGANLAAVCARRARDQRGPELRLQMLAYPITDHDFTTDSYTEQAEAWPLDRAAMQWFWDQYVPDLAERDHPDASPLRAADLGGLAPGIVIVAHHDPLREEVRAYTRALQRAGVALEVLEYADQPHGFLSMLNVLDASAPAVARVGGMIRERLRKPASRRPSIATDSTNSQQEVR